MSVVLFSTSLYQRQFIEQALEAARAALSERDFTATWEEGKAMSLQQAVDYARQVVKEIQGCDGINGCKK